MVISCCPLSQALPAVVLAYSRDETDFAQALGLTVQCVAINQVATGLWLHQHHQVHLYRYPMWQSNAGGTLNIGRTRRLFFHTRQRFFGRQYRPLNRFLAVNTVAHQYSLVK